MTHLRTRRAANGDAIAYHFFCTRSCWLGSFDEERIGPATASVEQGGPAPGAASEPGEHEEIHCAECGGMIASPWRPSSLLVGGVARPPLGDNGEAEPFNVMENPLLEQAWREHHIGKWDYEGGTIEHPITYRLDMWWDGRMDETRAVVAYVLRANNTTIFSGEDYKPSPMHDPGSAESAGGLIGFLSCKPGDTDAEFFANYTREQLEFVEAHGEEISIWGMQLEGELEDENA